LVLLLALILASAVALAVVIVIGAIGTPHTDFLLEPRTQIPVILSITLWFKISVRGHTLLACSFPWEEILHLFANISIFIVSDPTHALPRIVAPPALKELLQKPHALHLAE
jgi:hypothetical protein